MCICNVGVEKKFGLDNVENGVNGIVVLKEKIVEEKAKDKVDFEVKFKVRVECFGDVLKLFFKLIFMFVLK